MEFVFRKDIRAALIGRLMLRSCAANVFGLTNQEIVLDRTDKGKPKIKNAIDRTFDMNVSHHGRLAVLASDSSPKVGIDIMKIEDKDDVNKYFSLMARIFSNKEWTYIKKGAFFDRNISTKAQMTRFYRLWSLKEAYFKAEGMGITTDLRSIEFDCRSPVSATVIATDTQILVEGTLLSNCTFQETFIDDHCVAVCVMDLKEPIAVNYEMLSFEKLMCDLTPIEEFPFDGNYWMRYQSKLENPSGR